MNASSHPPDDMEGLPSILSPERNHFGKVLIANISMSRDNLIFHPLRANRMALMKRRGIEGFQSPCLMWISDLF